MSFVAVIQQHFEKKSLFSMTSGLCLDKLPPGSSSRYKQAEKEEQIMKCFERSGDISLVQLQDILDRGKGFAFTYKCVVHQGDSSF